MTRARTLEGGRRQPGIDSVADGIDGAFEDALDQPADLLEIRVAVERCILGHRRHCLGWLDDLPINPQGLAEILPPVVTITPVEDIARDLLPNRRRLDLPVEKLVVGRLQVMTLRGCVVADLVKAVADGQGDHEMVKPRELYRQLAVRVG